MRPGKSWSPMSRSQFDRRSRNRDRETERLRRISWLRSLWMGGGHLIGNYTSGEIHQLHHSPPPSSQGSWVFGLAWWASQGIEQVLLVKLRTGCFLMWKCGAVTKILILPMENTANTVVHAHFYMHCLGTFAVCLIFTMKKMVGICNIRKY